MYEVNISILGPIDTILNSAENPHAHLAKQPFQKRTGSIQLCKLLQSWKKLALVGGKLQVSY